MQGVHPRLSNPEEGKTCLAGIDLAGERIGVPGNSPNFCGDSQDSTAIPIAEMDSTRMGQVRLADPTQKVVEHYQWTGIPHSQLYGQMVGVIEKWNCHRVLVDATGIGQPVASFLKAQLGSKIIPFTFTQQSKSAMGFELLALVNSGRLKIYQQDGSPEYKELFWQLEHARAQYRPNQTMNFYVDPSEGHDDFLISLALVAEAAKYWSPRTAKGGLRNEL